ncbi:PREDICTED: uncharacterized protein LOC105561335, partial [Vollenhovia emeryi]|uniref:uncharacterized protein LOC105561335 n=1 Tax=Vollenhovia emeryi TaxID=411798 RepID=UPI0005F57BC2
MRREKRERAADEAAERAASEKMEGALADPTAQEVEPGPEESDGEESRLERMEDACSNYRAGLEGELSSAFRKVEGLNSFELAESALAFVEEYSRLARRLIVGENVERRRAALSGATERVLATVYLLWEQEYTSARLAEDLEEKMEGMVKKRPPPKRRSGWTQTARKTRERATSPAWLYPPRVVAWKASTQTPPLRGRRERATSPVKMEAPGEAVSTQTPLPRETWERATSPERVTGEDQACQTEGGVLGTSPPLEEVKSAAPLAWPDGLREEVIRLAGEAADRRCRFLLGIPSKEETPKQRDGDSGGEGDGESSSCSSPVPAQPREGKRGGSGGQAGVGVSGGRDGRGVAQRRARSRAPATAAVSLLVPEGDKRGATYAAVLRAAKEKVSLEGLGIGGMTCRGAANGGLLLEIPGAGRQAKADDLACRLRVALEDMGVRVARPGKFASLRLTGLDDSTTEEMAKLDISREGGCGAGEVGVSKITRHPSSARQRGTAWVRCPARVAHVIARTGAVRVGFAWARAKLAVRPGPQRCYRCLVVGHTRAECTAERDRSGRCYRCGQEGHEVGECRGRVPKCPLCSDLGIPSRHTLGESGCWQAPRGCGGR